MALTGSKRFEQGEVDCSSGIFGGKEMTTVSGERALYFSTRAGVTDRSLLCFASPWILLVEIRHLFHTEGEGPQMTSEEKKAAQDFEHELDANMIPRSEREPSYLASNAVETKLGKQFSSSMNYALFELDFLSLSCRQGQRR